MRLRECCRHESRKKGFKAKHRANYAAAFHGFVWFFTISCLMLNEITLKAAISLTKRESLACARFCCPVNVSSRNARKYRNFFVFHLEVSKLLQQSFRFRPTRPNTRIPRVPVDFGKRVLKCQYLGFTIDYAETFWMQRYYRIKLFMVVLECCSLWQ